MDRSRRADLGTHPARALRDRLLHRMRPVPIMCASGLPQERETGKPAALTRAGRGRDLPGSDPDRRAGPPDAVLRTAVSSGVRYRKRPSLCNT
jgi:hypothetical protein